MDRPDKKYLLDVRVGLMIETHYGWKEYCEEHGQQFLRVYPGTRYRSCDLYEVTVSSRQYRCNSCGELIWNPAARLEAKA